MNVDSSAGDALNRWILDSATDFAIVATDPAGRVTAWNRGASEILGWSEAEMLGQTIDRIFTTQDRAIDRPAQEMLDALTTGVGNDERWHLRKNGQLFWANGEMTPLRNSGDEVLGFVKVLRDRTAAHAAAQALLDRERETRLLMDSTAEGIYAVDATGQTTLCNAAFLRMMGFAKVEDAVGQRLHAVIHHSHPDGSPYPAAECPIYQCALTGTPAHAPDDVFFRLDGSPLAVEYWATPIVREGVQSGAICTFLDITERKQADQARRQAEASLQALNETLEARVEERTLERDRLWAASEDLLMLADYAGRLHRISYSWTRLLGRDETELLSKPYADLIHPDDLAKVAQRLEAMRAQATPVRCESRMRDSQGRWKTVSWQLSPDPGGERFNGIGRDMTAAIAHQAELEAAQDALRQSQKLEAVGQLTGGVAHDFNNLLTIISSSADFLLRPDLPEVRRRRYVEAIADTVQRATKLTNHLLAFARRQPLKPEVFDVGKKVRNTVELVRPLMGGRISVEITISDTACIAYADLGQFETALVNLMINARDAMDGEGAIGVTVSASEGIPAVRAHAEREGAFVAIEVADSGGGIAGDRLESIFEPFYTTKEVGKGTGLGLSQVFGFSKQSLGEVEVRSTLGQGSRFTLYLPRSPSAVPDDDPLPPVERERPVGDGACVLVVEDNEAVGQFSTEMLHDLGFKTNWAACAADALVLLADPDHHFDLVFSDVIMPGMNGVDFAREVRARYPGLPVVLTSGYSNVLAEQGSHGFDLIQKPYSVEALSRTLRKAMSAVRA